MNQKKHICPSCGSQNTVKRGLAKGVQSYECKGCSRRFRASRRHNRQQLSRELWCNYVFGKQTIKQLADTYGMDRRVVRHLLDAYTTPQKNHRPRPIHLVADGTYFGERKEGKSWCAIVARDLYVHENLLWSFEETETTVAYVWLKEQLEDIGYSYSA